MCRKGSEDTVTPKQLTSGKFQEEGAFWAKDSSKVFFLSTKVDDPSYELPRAEIYSVAVSGGEAQKVAAISMAPRSLSLSPDGKRVAFCASLNEPVKSYTQPDLWVMDLADGARPRNLTANYDFDVCSGVGGDQGTPRAGGGDKIIWSHDGNSFSPSRLSKAGPTSRNLMLLREKSRRSPKATRPWNDIAQPKMDQSSRF